MPIHKNDLVGKYVEFRDRNGATRISKVKKVTGNYLTTVNAVKKKQRVHLDNVVCQIHHGHVREEIIRVKK